MPTIKSIDSLSSQKSQRVTHKPVKVQTQKPHRPPELQIRPSANNAEKKLGFGKIIGVSFINGWRADVFHLSLIRALCSLRPFVLSILPVIFFQLTSGFLLKPDQALQMAHGIISTEQISTYIYAGGMLLAILCLSWFADMVIAPTLEKVTKARLDNRQFSTGKLLLSSMSELNASFGLRLLHGVQFIILAVFIIIIFGIGQLLATNSHQQITYGLICLVITIVALAKNEAIRWFGQGYLSATNSLASTYKLLFYKLFHRPFHNIGYGLIWLTGLGVYFVISIGLVWAEIVALGNLGNIGLSILLLATVTTMLYLIWTHWFGFSNSYWTMLALKRTPKTVLNQEQTSRSGYQKLRIWPVVTVLAILIFIVVAYFFVMITNVDIIINVVHSISSSLPKNVQLFIPKPN